MNENTDKPAIYIMKNVDGRLWYWEGKNDRPELHMLEALSEESLDNAIVAIRAHIAEMGETTNRKPTKLLVKPGLLKELGYTVEDVVKMIKAWPKVVRLPTAQQDPLAHADDARMKAEWQGLTDEEIHDCFQNRGRGSDGLKTRKMIAAAIEAKLKEKNT